MTDRIHAFTVVLTEDVREDDIASLRQAIALLRGVFSVELHVADINAHIAKQRAQAFYRSKILDVLMQDS